MKSPLLPPNWLWTTLGEVCEVILGQSPPSSTYNEQGNGLPFYQGSGEFGEMHPVAEKWCTKPKKIAEKTDILLSVRAPVGPTNICQETSVIGRGLAAIRYPFSDDHRFLFYFFRSIENALSQTGTGSTFSAITKSEVHNLPLPLPPLPEQRRIVARIEELFTKLDAGVEALKKVKAELKRYRQSVLKHAFGGRLTEEWRKNLRHAERPRATLSESDFGTSRSGVEGESKHVTRFAAEPTVPYGAGHPSTSLAESTRFAQGDAVAYEPASVFLARIREEKRKALGKKYKELTPLDTSSLPALPEGWAWMRVGDLISHRQNSVKRGPFGSAIKKSFFVPKGFKVYEQQNAIYDDHNLGSYFISAKKFEELKGFEVGPGDFIISCSGTIGRISRLPDNAPVGVINQALLKITIEDRLISPKFFLHLFRSEGFQDKMAKETRGSAMKNISSVDDIKAILVALPPLRQQDEIVAEIERRFSVADEVEKVVDESLKQAERLRQSILKRAFEGKLVEQDPNDPPASMLLEQLRAEKQQSKEASIGKTNKKKTRPTRSAGRRAGGELVGENTGGEEAKSTGGWEYEEKREKSGQAKATMRK